MGGTKIFVLQLKDLIRTAIFAVIGLALVIVLIVFLLPRQNQAVPEPSSSLYVPGTYSSAIILNDQPVDVRVTVSDNEITAVELDGMANIQRQFYPLFEPVMADLATEVLHYQSVEIALAENDYPVTTDILRQAVTAALDKAVSK